MTRLRNIRLERFGIFIYKILLWLSLGLVIGLFTAEMQGFISVWLLFVFIPGSIGLAWLFVQVFVRYTDHKARMATSDTASDSMNASPARIDSVDHGGMRLMEERNLLVIKMTVFSRFKPPFQTTIRQFMTAEQIERLQQLPVVTFYEDTHNPGSGTISLTPPTGELLTGETTAQATKIYPERSKSSFSSLIGRNSSMLTRLVNMVLIFALFGFGFLSPFMLTGNVDWLRLRVSYFPQKLVFQYKGNFNAEPFKKAYAKAMSYIGNRQVESLLFYKDYTVIMVEDPDKPGYIEHAIIRGNSVEKGILSSMTSDPDRLFTVDSVNFELLQKVLEDVATDHNIEDIFYIGVRSDTRWGTRDGHIPPDYKKNHVDIHVLFRPDSESLHYHGETGVRFPR